jgi:hypothetical protein
MPTTSLLPVFRLHEVSGVHRWNYSNTVLCNYLYRSPWIVNRLWCGQWHRFSVKLTSFRTISKLITRHVNIKRILQRFILLDGAAMVGDWPLVLLISPSRSLSWIGIDWYDNPNQFLYCWTIFFNTRTFCASIKFTTLEIPSLIPMYLRDFVRKLGLPTANSRVDVRLLCEFMQRKCMPKVGQVTADSIW